MTPSEAHEKMKALRAKFDSTDSLIEKRTIVAEMKIIVNEILEELKRPIRLWIDTEATEN